MSDIVQQILDSADPKKLKSIDCVTVCRCAILDQLDIAVRRENTTEEDYVNLLRDLYSDIVLRLAAMGVDVTNEE
jgi:hypothetical protein